LAYDRDWWRYVVSIVIFGFRKRCIIYLQAERLSASGPCKATCPHVVVTFWRGSCRVTKECGAATGIRQRSLRIPAHRHVHCAVSDRFTYSAGIYRPKILRVMQICVASVTRYGLGLILGCGRRSFVLRIARVGSWNPGFLFSGYRELVPCG
jgi:hypothetical protein